MRERTYLHPIHKTNTQVSERHERDVGSISTSCKIKKTKALIAQENVEMQLPIAGADVVFQRFRIHHLPTSSPEGKF